MLLQDLTYAVRTLGKNPGFTVVAVLCLALGVGVNATIFSVVDGVLLQPYPYRDADRIVVLNATNPRAGINRSSVSYPDYKDWRDQNSTLESIAAFTSRSLTISDGTSDPERFLGSTVSWTLFGLLGTPPAIGRDLRSRNHPAPPTTSSRPTTASVTGSIGANCSADDRAQGLKDCSQRVLFGRQG